MPSYPLPTLAASLTSSGISAPTYSDIYASLQASVKSIYGTDVVIDPDSQDGQLLAIVAQAINDSNSAAIAVYNSFSPATSQGEALSSNVKINGIARRVATNSTATVTLVGTVGTQILNGVVADVNSNLWNLPTSVTIPSAGFVNVTATAQLLGAILANSGEINKIQTPTLGWQSVTNALAASPGAPVETDAALRQRQTHSVALPSTTVLDGIVGLIESISGVSSVKAYENDTNATDSNGVPAHCISMVVQGGADADVAQAIFDKKTPGTGTYGSTTVTITEPAGFSNAIKFYRPTLNVISVEVQLHALTGYTTAIGTSVKQAVADYINSLSIGSSVMISRLYLPAQLNGAPDSLTFEVMSVKAAISPGTPGTTDVAIAFNARATATVANVSIVVV